MRVECVNNSGHKNRLTVGRTYEVIEINKTNYTIYNDKGYPMSVTKTMFKGEIIIS